MDPDDPRLARSNEYDRASPLALPVGWPTAIGQLTCQNNGRDEQGRPRFSTLLPETEYEFTADGTRFVTGAPGSVLELSR
jgi:hypothetical protein